jgi:class 3 adenylate cyclase
MASQAIFCVGCWQNMKLPIALRTIAAVPYRAVGIRQSRMNPNTCTRCETHFERVMKARQVELDASILFADLRGYEPFAVAVERRDRQASRRLLRRLRRSDLGARRHHQQDDGGRRPGYLQFSDQA